MQVKLNPMMGYPNSGIKILEEAMGIWRVDVYHESLKGEPLNLEAGMLHVGIIGRQEGANFCQNDSFARYLSRQQQEAVVAEVKRLHGAASTDAPVELTEEVIEDDDTE